MRKRNIVLLVFEESEITISTFEVKNRAGLDGRRSTNVLQSNRGVNKININSQNKKYCQKSNYVRLDIGSALIT